MNSWLDAHVVAANWRTAQLQAEQDTTDQDNEINELAPKLARLLGWLAEGRTTHQIGARTVAMLFVCRPDLLDGRSLEQLSDTTRQNLDKLVVDFRATFGYRATPRQMAKL